MKALVLWLASAALLLGGCGDDDPRAEASPTPSTSTSVPTTPTTSPPVTTSPAEEETPAEFIRRFEAAAFSMQRTGNADDYLALTDSCSSCKTFAGNVDRIFNDGGHIEGAGGRVGGIRMLGTSAGETLVRYVVKSRPSRVLGADGHVLQTFTGGTAQYRATLIRKGDSWRVRRLFEVVGS